MLGSLCHECDNTGITVLSWMPQTLPVVYDMYLMVSRTRANVPCMYCKTRDYEENRRLYG